MISIKTTTPTGSIISSACQLTQKSAYRAYNMSYFHPAMTDINPSNTCPLSLCCVSSVAVRLAYHLALVFIAGGGPMFSHQHAPFTVAECRAVIPHMCFSLQCWNAS
ncbi:hypothetical protein V2G26_016418 [Clonostachys chloroleuca]